MASVVGKSTPPPDAPSRVGARPKVVVLGDSIAAGLGLPVADLNSANFGRVFSAGPPRLMQFALKLMF